jgi:hypothetical protein
MERNGFFRLLSFAFIEIDPMCKVLVIQLDCDRKAAGKNRQKSRTFLLISPTLNSFFTVKVRAAMNFSVGNGLGDIRLLSAWARERSFKFPAQKCTNSLISSKCHRQSSHRRQRIYIFSSIQIAPPANDRS